MKLNLLPATVTKGRASRTAWIASVLIIFVGIGLSLAMTIMSAKALSDAKQAYEESIPAAQRAYETSQKADQLMNNPGVANLAKNVALAQAMIAHNDRYPDLYDSLRRYIPPFYRITSIAAAPMGEGQASVTLQGTLDSYQQYADLMLALMMNREAVSVARSGFQTNDPFVPQLTSIDQTGTPRKPGESPIPDDPLQRLEFFQANPGPSAEQYTGIGNYGDPRPVTRFAMPGASLVTVQLILNHDLQVPNPRATLGSGGGGGGGIPGGGGPPAGGPPAGVGGKLGGPAPATGGGGADPGLAGGGDRNQDR
jgi:hypothetical protein